MEDGGWRMEDRGWRMEDADPGLRVPELESTCSWDLSR